MSSRTDSSRIGPRPASPGGSLSLVSRTEAVAADVVAKAGRKGVRLARILGAVKAARAVLASFGTGPGGFSRIDPLEDSPDAGAGKRGTRERNVRH